MANKNTVVELEPQFCNNGRQVALTAVAATVSIFSLHHLISLLFLSEFLMTLSPFK